MIRVGPPITIRITQEKRRGPQMTRVGPTITITTTITIEKAYK